MRSNLIFVLVFLFLTATVNAQTADTEEPAEKPSNRHFAINAGTQYFQTHFNGIYYNENPGDKIEKDWDVDFNRTMGIWIGGNINYRTSRKWHFSSEVAFRFYKAGYKATNKHQIYIDYGVVDIKAYEIVVNPISLKRNIHLTDKWKVPISFGTHWAFNLYHEHDYWQTFVPNQPDLGRNHVYKRFHLTGAGIAIESGLTRILDQGELSFLIIPTPNRTYFTKELPYLFFHAATSGAIIKVQYAFK